MEATAKNFAGRRVLVTGAGGFIGGHLARRLTHAGAIVHAVAREAVRAEGVAQVHAVDVADGPSVERLVATVRPDYVFHLASLVSGLREMTEVMRTFESNLASTVHLLRAVTGSGCQRMVLAGSLEEISAGEAPSSPYAASKSAASMYARMFFQLYQTPVTIARIFMVYGPGQHDVRKLVPYVTVSLLTGRSPRLSSGVRPVDWIYVDDVVDSLLCCALAPNLEGKTVDVGTGHTTTVRSVAEQIRRLVGEGAPLFGAIQDRPLEQIRVADPSCVLSLLGRPLTALGEGLHRTVAWYREHVAAGEIDLAVLR